MKMNKEFNSIIVLFFLPLFFDLLNWFREFPLTIEYLSINNVKGFEEIIFYTRNEYFYNRIIPSIEITLFVVLLYLLIIYLLERGIIK
jgi:hypothetical protein